MADFRIYNMTKNLILFIVSLFIFTHSFGQCNGTQSFTMTPSAPAGGYLPGTVVNVSYTMNGYSQSGSNWAEGFSLSLGSGWTNLTPTNPPTNCGGGGGQWIWMNSNSTPVGTVGPGYFFDLNMNGVASDDFGDAGTCSWTFNFSVTVSNLCTPQSLSIQISAGSDGLWGSWGSTSCDVLTPFNVYSGTINSQQITLNPTIVSDTCNVGYGSISLQPTPINAGPFNYNWTTLGLNTSSVTGLNAGTYPVIVSYGNGCIKNGSYTITNIQPTYSSTSTIINCFGDSTGTVTANMTPPLGTLSYSWMGYLNQTTQTATNLPEGVYTCTITSSNGCVGTTSVGVNSIPPISILNVDITDVTCNQNDGQLIVLGGGGTSPYTYYLDNIISNDTITNLSGGNYIVGLEDINGCTTNETVYVDFPIPVTPLLVPDVYELCVPGTFLFTNTSTPISEVISSYITFGDTQDTTVLLGNNFTHEYTTVGDWTLTMTVLSNYGCTYIQTFTDLVETRPLPIAEFTISPNPTTMFETTIIAQDQSQTNIVSWEWDAPGSTQMVSNYDNPHFSYPEGVVDNYMIYLTVEDDLGCRDSVSHQLVVLSDILVYVPNAFTPDGNEHNQIWEYHFNGISDDGFSMLVFNRWGELIWESHNPNVFWDGSYGSTYVPDGVYVWKSTVTSIITAEKRSFTGTVTILR